MKKSIILFILTLILMPSIQGQIVSEVGIPDPNLYEKKILRKFKRLPCYDKNANYKILPVFSLGIIDYSLDKFTSESLLSNLKFVYRKRGTFKDFPMMFAYIYDDSLNSVACTDSHFNLLCNLGNHDTAELIKLCVEMQAEFIFMFDGIMCTYVLKNGYIYVFELGQDNKYKIYALEEYIKNEENVKYMSMKLWSSNYH